MRVPRLLEVGDTWLNQYANVEHLRLFLVAHRIDIDDVYKIQFGSRSMTVYQYDHPRRAGKNGVTARLDPLKIKYRAGLVPELIS